MMISPAHYGVTYASGKSLIHITNVLSPDLVGFAIIARILPCEKIPLG
jgi:hypothetical protein